MENIEIFTLFVVCFLSFLYYLNNYSKNQKVVGYVEWTNGKIENCGMFETFHDFERWKDEMFSSYREKIKRITFEYYESDGE